MNTQFTFCGLYRSKAPGLGLLVIAAIVVLSGCSDSSGEVLEPQPYYHVADARTVVRQTSYSVPREFAGLAHARQSAELGFELSGKLTAVYVEEGEHVATDAVLAELDVELLNNTRAELQAQRQETTARLALSEANLARLKSLLNKGFSSAQQIDELQAERLALLAGIDRLDAALAANATRIRKSTLRAPFAGIIGRRYVDQGVVVNPGAPVLKLLQTGAMEARVGIPTRLLGLIAVGDTVDVRIGDSIVPAPIISIGADVNQATRTVAVRLRLPQSTRDSIQAPIQAPIPIVDGDMVYLRLDEAVVGSGFWAPLTALSEGLRGLWNIYVLQPTADPNVYRILSRDVQISYIDSDRAYLSGALTDDELIVGAGVHRLVPGQLVRREDKLAAR